MKPETTLSRPIPPPARLQHPIDVANAKLPPEYAKSRYGKWRALSLVLVYVAMIIHITHWKVSGKTMAPLELSEIMKALELGVVSPGVIFIGVMLVGSAILGRFFCSWGCHMLAVQDLCHWILKKLRIRPIAIRSRVLLLAPFGAAVYMFFWPQIKRIWEGRDLPEAAARLTTTNFWRDLPGPFVITLTFLVCGFFVVYLFGGRGFCRYGCPYGVLFGLFDRLSPGKIRARDGCQQCGRCTAVCTSCVRVHEQIKTYGMVVDPRCMKDLDCVSVCPNNVLHYGFGRPTLARVRKGPRLARRYDFSIAEEIVMAALFLPALLIWRGLYDALPFLMSIALAAITVYVLITSARLLRRGDLAINRYVLKQGGCWRKAGHVFAGVGGAFLLFAGHSGFVQYHKRLGEMHFDRAQTMVGRDAAATERRRGEIELALEHLLASRRYGLVAPAALQMSIGTMLLEQGRAAEAEAALRHAVEKQPAWPEARITLAEALEKNNKPTEAASHLVDALDIWSPHEEHLPRFEHLYAKAHAKLGGLLFKQGNLDLAERHYEEALRLDPQSADAELGLGLVAANRGRLDDAVRRFRNVIAATPQAAEALANLGDVLTAQGDAESAIKEYNDALRIDPQIAMVHFKIGVITYHLRRLDESAEHLATAVRQAPNDAAARNHHGLALAELGRLEEARAEFEKAIALDESYADAHYNLARVSAAAGDSNTARRHFERAAHLDARYATPGA